MTTVLPRELEQIAVGIATEAATLIAGAVGSAHVTATKSTVTDVVTATDLAAERLIRRRLLAATPDATVLGEEQGGSLRGDGIEWIVDPLDGTVNFLYDLPVVAVSIAATSGGVVVAGAVADVLRGEVHHASRGRGARRDGRPVTVRDPVDLASSLVLTGYSYDPVRRGEQGQVTARLLGQVRDIRNLGSTALQLCLVACGRADGFFQDDVQPWDHAAGALIAAEAGASVTLPVVRDGMVVAAVPSIHAALSAAVLPSDHGPRLA